MATDVSLANTAPGNRDCPELNLISKISFIARASGNQNYLLE